MPALAANLGMLFVEHPFPQRFAAAADAGFGHVELPFVGQYRVAQLVAWLRAAGLTQVLANVPSEPDRRGLAALPGHEAAFRAAFLRGLEYAVGSGCGNLHVTTGAVPPEGLSAATLTLSENLQWAIAQASRYGVTVLIEAINQKAIPDYFVRSLADAAAWCRRLPGLKLLLDLYHASIEGLDPVASIGLYADLIGHVQIAGVPDRREPDQGRLDLAAIHHALMNIGYSGEVGCEYNPARSTEAGLAWIKAWRLSSRQHA